MSNSTSAMPTDPSGAKDPQTATSTEPTIIAEQDRKPADGPSSIPADPQAVENAKNHPPS